jgi:ABC-type nitrate/sulfonate/bicarbonate transport system permease component
MERHSMTRTGRMRRGVVPALTAAALAAGLWYAVALLAGRARGVDFPMPHDAGAALASLLAGRHLSGHSVYVHVAASLARWAAGFAIAAVGGTGFGLLAGWWGPVERIGAPIVQAAQLVPGLAWIPAAILLFGIGEGATVFMVAAAGLPPVAVSVLGGAKRVDATYLRAARMMGARGMALPLRVLLPGALPQIVTGLRVGVGNAWRVMVAAEMVVGTGTGLGYSIIQARWTLDYASAFACVGLICLLGLVFERVVFVNLERWTVERWGLLRTP